MDAKTRIRLSSGCGYTRHNIGQKWRSSLNISAPTWPIFWRVSKAMIWDVESAESGSLQAGVRQVCNRNKAMVLFVPWWRSLATSKEEGQTLTKRRHEPQA